MIGRGVRPRAEVAQSAVALRVPPEGRSQEVGVTVI